jgi:dienelactone hydrolase
MFRISRLVVCLLVALMVFPPAALAQGTPPASDDQQAVAQAVIDNMIAGDFEAATANFNDSMLGALPPDTLSQTWDTLLMQVGAFQSVDDEITSQAQDDLTTYFFILRFEKMALQASVTVDAEGQVAGLYFKPAPEAPAADDPSAAIARAVIDNMIAGDFEAAAANFTDTVLAAVTPADLEQAWNQFVQQVGPFQSVDDNVGSQTQGTLTSYAFILHFEQATLAAQVTVNEDGQIAGLFFTSPDTSLDNTPYEPPAYADESAFIEQDVAVNAGTEWELPGTLTLPVGDGPFPVVVLVHGSGPNDRDETVGPNKPFKDLAWGLASQGIAVLRYDKRTNVYGAQVAAQADFTVAEETIDDAVAAVDLLRSTEGIDPAQIYVLGHSQGGYLAPRIALQAEDLGGVIIMAGNTRPLTDLIVEQTKYLLTIDDGTFSDADQAYLDDTTATVEATKNAQPGDDPVMLLFNAPASYWIDLNGYDPVATAQEVTAPILVLQGERDYQVTLDDFAGWQLALEGRDDATFKTYADLNHLFLSGEGDPNPTEYQTPGHIPQTVIDDIAGWITAHS